jgi:hypothetical protein
MSTVEHLIPAHLNLVLSTGTLVALVTILRFAGRVHSTWELFGLVAAYGLVMNTGYALAHESEHGILHPNRTINLWCGVVLMLFSGSVPSHAARPPGASHAESLR